MIRAFRSVSFHLVLAVAIAAGALAALAWRDAWPISGGILLLLTVAQIFAVRHWQKLQSDLIRVRARAESAETDSRAKTALLNILGHDLRTPLNAIIGYSELMQRHSFGPLGAPQYENYLADIQRGGETLVRVVDDLARIAEIQTDAVSLTDRPADLEALLKTLLQELQPLADEKHLSLRLHSFGPVWCRYGGPELKTVFVHLIENAIKFCETGGEICIAIMRRDEKIAVDVRGSGVLQAAPEYRGGSISQADGHLLLRQGRPSIGLSIANSLVTLMGGGLDVRSTFGKGTTVRVTLPPAKPFVDRVAADKTKAPDKVAAAA